MSLNKFGQGRPWGSPPPNGTRSDDPFGLGKSSLNKLELWSIDKSALSQETTWPSLRPPAGGGSALGRYQLPVVDWPALTASAREPRVRIRPTAFSATLPRSASPPPLLRIGDIEITGSDLISIRDRQAAFFEGELRAVADTLNPMKAWAGAVGLWNSFRSHGAMDTIGVVTGSLLDGFLAVDGDNQVEAGARFMGSVATLATVAHGMRGGARPGAVYASGEWQYLRTPFVQYTWQGRHKQIVLNAAKEAVLGADGQPLTQWHWLRVARLTPRVGDKVYRVWGWNEFPSNNWHDHELGSPPLGQSWTMVDPRTSPAFRSAAGLPDVNPGRFLIEGTLRDTAAFGEWLPAKALDGHPGGWPEWLMKPWDHPESIHIDRVLGLHAQF